VYERHEQTDHQAEWKCHQRYTDRNDGSQQNVVEEAAHGLK
jgi:hypothetical protein